MKNILILTVVIGNLIAVSLSFPSESSELFKANVINSDLEIVKSLPPVASILKDEQTAEGESSKVHPDKLGWAWNVGFGTGEKPISWSLPGYTGNASLNVATDGSLGKKPKPGLCPNGQCPDQDELCDTACRDYGKSGGLFCIDKAAAGLLQQSCQCYCQPPTTPGQAPYPCTDSSECYTFCKTNTLFPYPAGGSCIRNVCQCLCNIQDPYNPAIPWVIFDQSTTKPPNVGTPTPEPTTKLLT